MWRKTAIEVCLLMVAAGAVASCVGRPVPADVRVPPDLLRGSAYTAAGEPPRSRYVVRMTDGVRDWEIQLPEIATAYEVSVPLQGKPSTPMGVNLATLTAADREILSEQSGTPPSGDGPADADGGGRSRLVPAGGGGDKAARGDDDDGEAPKPAPGGKGARRPRPGPEAGGEAAATPHNSYLLTLARVKDLYRTRHYELALVEIVELEKQYPGDERILSMKGSLYERMGNKNLARDAWQQVLALNPFNLAVLEALQRLGK